MPMNNQKKYCRYCANAVLTENEIIVWCEAKKQERHKNNCITVNKCKDFVFNEIDVFWIGEFDKTYKPRQLRKKTVDNQIKLEVESE